MSELRDRIEELQRLAEENPASPTAQVNLATALIKCGNYKSAEACLRRALELEPELPEALVNLGGILLSRWDFRGCVEANRRARELKPDLLLAHYNEGLGHLYLKEAEVMLACFERVVELEPRHPGGRYHRAVGLWAVGRKEEARKELAIAIELGFKPESDFLKAVERDQQAAVPVIEIGEDREKDLP